MKKIFSLLGLLMLLFSSGAWADSTFNATLNHTAGAQWGSNTGASTVDAEKEHYNNDSGSAWAGCAYAKFSFNIPSGEFIKKVTLTYNVNQGGKQGRNDIIYYMAKDFDLDWDAFAGQTGKDLRNASSRAGKAIEAAPTGGIGDRLNLTQDVTNAVKAIYNAGQNYIIFQWTGNAGGADLYGKGSTDKYPVLTIETTASLSTYTINYQLSGTTIKSDSGSNGTGEVIEADQSFWENGTKYLAIDGATTSITLADGNNVLNVPVREANEYTLTVKTSLGTVLSTKTVVEGENADYFVPYYYFNNGKFYTSPTSSAGNVSYGKGTISNVTSDIDVILTYTEEANTKVVFYSEAENLAGITEQNDGYTNSRMSNGAAGYFADPTSIKTLQPGVYTLTAATRSGTTKFYAGETEILNLSSTGSVVTATSDEFIISNESAIVATAGSDKNYFDYVIIRKTKEIWEADGYVAADGITISEAEATIGATTTMKATVSPATATLKSVKWSVEDESVATIDEKSGELTPLKAGKVKVIAKTGAPGEPSGEYELTIAPAEFAVSFTDAPQDGTQVFVGNDASADGVLSVTTKAGYDQMTSTSMLQPLGSVTATEIPTYIYSIAVDKTAKTISVTYERDIEVTAMEFAVAEQRIAQGNSRTLKVTYYPANASFKTAKWTSSNPEVATVDENTGLVKALSEGETTITAEWAENESHGTDYSAQMTLTVDKGLVIDNIVYDEMEDGTAEVMGYYFPLPSDTLYLPSAIESNGRMIPVSFIDQEAFIGNNLKCIVIPGTVKIIDHRAIEYSNNHNAYNEQPEEGLESAFLLEGVEVMRDRIFFGNKYMTKVFLPSTLKEIGYYSFDETNVKDVYYGGTEEQWDTLNVNTKARYGESAISFSKLPEDVKIHFNSDFITAFINSIEVEDEIVELKAEETYQIEATVTPKIVAPSVTLTYSSSDEGVATVDANGLVTAIADGFATITISAGSGVETKVRVKVGNPSEKENLLTMTFEDGEVADYWAFSNEGSSLIEPAAEGSTGRAATIIATKDRGDYVKVNPDLSGVTKYEVSMDLLITKSPKTTQFSVLTNSSWDSWTHNYGMFWKTTSAQSHNSYLFNMNIPASNTAEINIDIDAAGEAVAAQQTWDYVNGTWYTLKLNVDVNAHTVEYTIAPKSDLTAVEVTGSYTVPADENMQIKGIYERNGRYNYEPGAIAIDNVIVDAVERGTVEGSDQLTGISEAQSNESTVKSGKYVENGQIVIYIDGKKFNAAGQQIK